MKLNLKLIGVAFLLGAVSSATSHALVGVSLVGVGNFASPDFTDSGTTYSEKGKLAIGYGGLVDFQTGSHTSLEAGFLYVKSKAESTTGAIVTDLEYKAIEIPVLLRFNFLRHFSIGAGGYYGHLTGDVTASITTGGNTTTQSVSVDRRTDYGLVGSASVHIPLGPMMSFLVDGRYVYGLRNLVANPDKFETRDMEILAGLHLGF